MTQYVLGIETSCDETAAAIVSSDGVICSNVIASQIDDHRPHGGVVPEVAARAHLTFIDKVIEKALKEAQISMDTISGVAATGGPGLIGGVIVGVGVAKTIALGLGVPFYAINHLEGHALTARLTEDIAFPYLLLLVSGGHTQLLEVMAPGQYQRYGTTIDDAAGEAFDKSAKVLGLDMPGGPAIEKLAAHGDETGFDLPRPLLGRPGCDFSFSGLKTAVLTAHKNTIASLKQGEIRKQHEANLAASLERTIAEILCVQSHKAADIFAKRNPTLKHRAFAAAGGVAANQRIRAQITSTMEQAGFKVFIPPLNLCGDNAVMIAWAAIERKMAGLPPDGLDFEPRPRWPLCGTPDEAIGG